MLFRSQCEFDRVDTASGVDGLQQTHNALRHTRRIGGHNAAGAKATVAKSTPAAVAKPAIAKGAVTESAVAKFAIAKRAVGRRRARAWPSGNNAVVFAERAPSALPWSIIFNHST